MGRTYGVELFSPRLCRGIARRIASQGKGQWSVHVERPQRGMIRSATRTTFVTTTTYGSWLPGDLRGYVQDGVVLPGSPRLLDHARSLLGREPVSFNDAEIVKLECAIRAAADEFHYRLTDLAIESWHLHWIIGHGADAVATMVGRLKTRMRQAIGRGRIWTDGYCHRNLHAPEEFAAARRYIARHHGCRMLDGRSVAR
jgi:hypothetical protein